MKKVFQPLAERGSYFIENAHILSMDDTIGEIEGASIHIEEGVIRAVGKNLERPANAEIIDGTDSIVMPGFVDTHWHMWTSLYRGMAETSGIRSYMWYRNNVGDHFTPEDNYLGVCLASAEAINTGITTVHHWAHNMNTPEFADTAVAAHREAGLRCRFSYGTRQWLKRDEIFDVADLERVQKSYFPDQDGLLTLGVCMRGPEFGGTTPEVYCAEWAHARRLGLPITVHVAEFREQNEKWKAVRALAEHDLLGPDIQLVHLVHSDAEERRMIVETGTHASLSPHVEGYAAMGLNPVMDLIRDGIQVSLSLDATVNIPADTFGMARYVFMQERGRLEKRDAISAEQAVRLVTIEGAKEMGIADITGSLTPGKRADVIMLKAYGHDPLRTKYITASEAIIQAGNPNHVDTVFADGRPLKRNGLLVNADVSELMAAKHAAQDAMYVRAGL